MGDSNKQTCQLCLDKTPGSECEIIDETKKAMLEFLLININFDISEFAVVCTMCLKRLQESFDFKSRCSTTFGEADNKVDVAKVFAMEMTSNDGSISLGSSQVCRLCLSATNNVCETNYITNFNDGVLLQEMIKYCFPEMDLSDVNAPAICKSCLNSLKGFHEFLKSCREVERLCQLVIPSTVDIPILEEMLKSKDFEELGKSIIIKKEFSDAENDVNPVTCLKNEDTPTIKCEELEIKDESDTGEVMDDSVPSGASNNNSRQSDSLKSKMQISESPSKGRADILSEDHMASHTGNKCIKCDYETIYKSCLVRHMLTHRDHNEERKFKCDKCPYETDRMYSLTRHSVIHKDKSEVVVPERKYKCDKCPYETNRMYTLRRHNLTHRDKSEVELYKCANCEFETKHKNSIIQHMRKHGDTNAERKFKCNECPYETDVSSHLHRHILIHMDKSEVEMYKCDNCDYEARQKVSIIQHMLKHRKPKAEKEFKCDKCSYETDIRSQLIRHSLIHKEKSEVEMHKCENCEFETRHKNCLIQHVLTHRDPKVERKFKCDKCTYETDFKYSLRMHYLRHKDKSEVEMYKCENCKYETRYKFVMIRHKLKHRDPTTEKKFKCDKCKYETVSKDNLKKHNLKHKDKSEVEMYKCENCEFETRYKYDKTRHMLKNCEARAKGKS